MFQCLHLDLNKLYVAIYDVAISEAVVVRIESQQSSCSRWHFILSHVLTWFVLL